MRIIILFISIILYVGCTTAQKGQYQTTDKKAIKLYEKALESYRNVSQYTGKGDLDGAEKYLIQAVSRDPSFVDAHIFLSEVYMEKGLLHEAIDAKLAGIKANPNYSANEYFYLASLYMMDGNYVESKKHAEKFLKFTGSVNPRFQEEAQVYIENADFAEVAMKNPVNFTPKNMGPNINTENPEYFPTITGDDQTFLFTRRIRDERIPMQLGGQQEDFFVTIKGADGEWKVSKSISDKINTMFNEGAPTLSADGNYLVFTSCQLMDAGYGENRNGYGSCDLFYSKRIGSRWSMPRNLGAPINTQHWESQPCFSADGTSIYFIRGERGNGGRIDPQTQDIYVTSLTDEGRWSKPKKLNMNINTPKREESVFIHPDGQTLYFASNGHPGMGGTDIYMSKLDELGDWGKPVNLGYPINTHNDENSLLISANGELGFFASDREGGYGDLDLYSFELPEHLKPVPTTYMKGIVYDEDTRMPMEAQVQLIDLETGKPFYTSISNSLSGDFLVNIPTNKEFALNVAHPNYFFYSKNYSFKGTNSKAEPYLIDVPLSKIKVGEKGFVLENIFFDVNKYDLKPASAAELNKLLEFMNRNPKIRVEIGGHTDSDGNDAANQLLSENRAKAVVDFLVSKGIDKSRMEFKGYGETKPRVDNDTPENKAKNRRTELKIIGEIE